MIPTPGLRPIVPVKMRKRWSASAFLDCVGRDTRAWFRDDWHDIRPHMSILGAFALSVNVTDPRAPIQRPPLCVEIGVRYGASTLPLLMAMQATGGRLVSLDIDLETYAEAYERIEAAGLLPWWEPMAWSSTYADVPQRIDLLFIDGDHSLEQVRIDFDRFSPAVRLGGFCLMHDYYRTLDPWDTEGHTSGQQDTGVPVVVEEARQSGKWEVLVVPVAYGLAIMRRVGE